MNCYRVQNDGILVSLPECRHCEKIFDFRGNPLNFSIVEFTLDCFGLFWLLPRNDVG